MVSFCFGSPLGKGWILDSALFCKSLAAQAALFESGKDLCLEIRAVVTAPDAVRLDEGPSFDVSRFIRRCHSYAPYGIYVSAG